MGRFLALKKALLPSAFQQFQIMLGTLLVRGAEHGEAVLGTDNELTGFVLDSICGVAAQAWSFLATTIKPLTQSLPSLRRSSLAQLSISMPAWLRLCSI